MLKDIKDAKEISCYDALTGRYTGEEDGWQICCELKHMPGAGCIVIERFSMNNTTREEVVKEMERIIIEGRL
ncbi:hypothetical protein [Blautia faecis]|uniref:Uncharacterized protein n=1 Tax=Blautia faecis TaxID=871665 RepID=A0ABX2H2A0_9FIRM|nr:hypothetical protein [Blautia faecis]NSG84213.1 hypothetical protein [Blautia faecis]